MKKSIESAFYIFLVLLVLSSCKKEEGGEGANSTLAGSSSYRFVENSFDLKILSHTPGGEYTSESLFFEYISGEVTAKDYSGFLEVKWETSINGIVKFSGLGGLTNTERKEGGFKGTWSLLNVRLVNGVKNNLSITISDAIGNTVSQKIFVICEVPAPTILLTNPVGGSTLWGAGQEVSVSGTLKSSVQIDSLIWENETTGNSGLVFADAAWNTSVSVNEGVNSLRFTVEDIAGNSSNISVSLGRDITSPELALTTPVASVSSTSLVNYDLTPISISGTASDSQSGLDKITWSNEATGDTGVASGEALWTIPSVAVLEGENKITITALDKVGQSKDFVLLYIVDRSPPNFAFGSFLLNDGDPSTTSSIIEIDITITDSLSKIIKFCFKNNDNTLPNALDGCWENVSLPGKSITLNNHLFDVGSSFTSNLYVWAMDEVGNISFLTNSNQGTLARDTAAINYILGVSPSSAQISNLYIANIESMNLPPVKVQTQASPGADIYIKWKVTDDLVIPSGGVDLFYTLDDENYTLISSGVDDIANTGCSIDGSFTGCFKWTGGAPSSNYFKIKMTVKNSSNILTIGSSNSFNTGSLSMITGSTDLGLEGAAQNSIVFTQGEGNYNDRADPGAFVVTETGYVFIKDYHRGLLYIDPSDGIIRQLTPETGTASGDAGAARDATLRSFAYLALDFSGNLIIWDGPLVRKIDLSATPWTINTLFGGGGDASDSAPALSSQIPYRSNSSMLLTPTPSGKIYFNKTGHDIWYFDPGNNTINKTLTLSGVGTDDMLGSKSVYDNAQCTLSLMGISYDTGSSELTSVVALAKRGAETYCGEGSNSSIWHTNFDPISGVSTLPHPTGYDSYSAYKHTGMDGKLYLMEHGRDQLNTYNPLTHHWDHLMGVVGSPGRCVDGTPMTLCNMKMMSLFVNKNGRIYFIDMGVIRFVDDTDKVQTLAGQPRNFGVGQHPLSARYSKIAYFSVAGNDLYIKDALEQQIVKVPLLGGNLEHIAGNSVKANPAAGSSSLNTSLNNCRWSMSCGFQVNSSGDKLYHSSGSSMFYIDLPTLEWRSTGIGGISQISVNALSSSGHMLLYTNIHGGSSGDRTRLMSFDPLTPSLTTIYGSDTYGKNSSELICNDGSIGTDCLIGYRHDDTISTQYKHDAVTDNWLILKRNTRTVHEIPHAGGVVSLLTTTNNNIYSFEHRRVAGERIIYYCASNGNLYKKNVTTGVEAEIPIGVSSLSCSGNSLHYHAGRDSLMFIFKQNYLFGIAEITSPGQ